MLLEINCNLVRMRYSNAWRQIGHGPLFNHLKIYWGDNEELLLEILYVLKWKYFHNCQGLEIEHNNFNTCTSPASLRILDLQGIIFKGICGNAS